MTLGSAADILAAGRVGVPHVFYVHGWKDSVYLRDPSMADRAEWEAFVAEHNGKLTDAAAGKMAQIFLCDADGERLLTEADIPKLNAKAQEGMLQIFKKCVELLDISEKQIEDMEGN